MNDRWRRWAPSSKVTAVGIAGGLYTWGVYALITWYGATLDALTVAANQAWIVFLVAYVVTENRWKE